jgi:hypothetical protein
MQDFLPSSLYSSVLLLYFRQNRNRLVCGAIIKEAMRSETELTKEPAIPNFKPTVPTKVAIDREEISLV